MCVIYVMKCHIVASLEIFHNLIAKIIVSERIKEYREQKPNDNTENECVCVRWNILSSISCKIVWKMKFRAFF